MIIDEYTGLIYEPAKIKQKHTLKTKIKDENNQDFSKRIKTKIKQLRSNYKEDQAR